MLFIGVQIIGGFEKFRNLYIQNYQLDPAYYIILPCLTFDAMLKYVDVHLKLFVGYDIYL